MWHCSFQATRCLNKKISNEITNHAKLYLYSIFNGECCINWIITYASSGICLFP